MNVNNQVKFSIIMPVYNVVDYLESAIESVVVQNYKNWELILVNDGSTDGSEQIVNRYAKMHSNIRAINKKNTGVSDCRNIGLKESSGDFVLFMDSDDLYEKDILKTLEKYISDEDSILMFDFNRVGKKDNNIDSQHIIINSADLISDFYSEKAHGAVWQFAVRKSALATVKPFNNNLTMYEDLIWTLDLLYQYPKVHFINEKLYTYRFRKGSVIETVSWKKLKSMTSALTEVRKIIDVQENGHANNFYIWKNNLNIVRYFHHSLLGWQDSTQRKIDRKEIIKSGIKGLRRKQAIIFILIKYRLLWIFLPFLRSKKI